MGTQTFNVVWQRIAACQGQQFRTVRGLPFIYEVNGQVVRGDRAKQNLPRSEFAKAYSLMPLKGPGEINDDVRGPAYAYTILTDLRIAGLASPEKD